MARHGMFVDVQVQGGSFSGCHSAESALQEPFDGVRGATSKIEIVRTHQVRYYGVLKPMI
jgi:hypothetical protein